MGSPEGRRSERRSDGRGEEEKEPKSLNPALAANLEVEDGRTDAFGKRRERQEDGGQGPPDGGRGGKDAPQMPQRLTDQSPQADERKKIEE